MRMVLFLALPTMVALLAESVDRNPLRVILYPIHQMVALLAESVDRNITLRLVILTL